MNNLTHGLLTGFISLLLIIFIIACTDSSTQLEWPEMTRESKPWTRWWWHGNSVNKNDLTASLGAYQKAGLGGVEITPIYGVIGKEDQFINYLSPQWMEMLTHTLKEAERLDLGVDMATGTGWPFGGPWVTFDDAPKNVAYKTYILKAGESLGEPVSFRQEPILRAVRNQVYQLYGLYRQQGEKTTGSQQEPVIDKNIKVVDMSDLVEPISANRNLQGLALDQVKFEKQLPLQVLMGYCDAGEILNLTDKVDANGKLNWIAPASSWILYAVFQGWHGKMVERAAPGGEGNTIDHFSNAAIKNYLMKFDSAFSGHDIRTLRAFFNDSYEVDDASGQADWTPKLFEEFEKRRGYDLREHLPALFGKDTTDKSIRLLCDYRETISDLLLETFTHEWREWAKGKGAIVRNQAHGSPANILDLYAASDIPETEGTDILGIKFASSASNITGKRLTSSESSTWLNEHFQSSLAHVKKNLEKYLLGSVNHIVYHGTAYSPQDEPWPGWLFYAAVHFNPRNSFWRDFPALNNYIARVQSFMQAAKPNNDVLIYFPIYDFFSASGSRGLLGHFEAGARRLDGSAFKASAETLQDRGYAFDYISDRQLQNVDFADRMLHTGGVLYQTAILPECRFIPLETLEKLVELVEDGATVIVYKSLPGEVPGMGNLEARHKRFEALIHQINFATTKNEGIGEAGVGKGRFLLGDDLDQLLSYAGIRREAMVDEGLEFVRRTYKQGHCYFIANWGDKPVDGWVPLAINARSAAIFDPMFEKSGVAKTRTSEGGGIEIYLQLAPGESCIVKTFASTIKGPAYDYLNAIGEPQEIAGTWKVSFVEGGPELPSEIETDTLASWTDFGGEAVKKFSGMAKYTISFQKPEGNGKGWFLDLGRVAESASVRLNGNALGTLIGPNYRIFVDKSVVKENNVLEVNVSNLMANRIADLDKRGVFWKKFYNINFPARRGENRGPDNLFTAADWEPVPSGLIGPVTLTAVEVMAF